MKSVSAFANGLGGSLFFGGLTRICNETKALEGYKDELKPVFKSTPTQFQTIIFASSDTSNVGDHDGDMSETKLTERQQKILNLIKESPTITGKQMSETLSVSQRTIERDLSALQKIGVLKHEGKDNDGVWVVLEKKTRYLLLRRLAIVKTIKYEHKIAILSSVLIWQLGS